MVGLQLFHGRRYAGYDDYNNFINSQECYSAIVNLLLPTPVLASPWVSSFLHVIFSFANFLPSGEVCNEKQLFCPTLKL